MVSPWRLVGVDLRTANLQIHSKRIDDVEAFAVRLRIESDLLQRRFRLLLVPIGDRDCNLIDRSPPLLLLPAATALWRIATRASSTSSAASGVIAGATPSTSTTTTAASCCIAARRCRSGIRIANRTARNEECSSFARSKHLISGAAIVVLVGIVHPKELDVKVSRLAVSVPVTSYETGFTAIV